MNLFQALNYPLLAQYLDDQGIGTVGKDIFVTTMPSNLNEGLMFRDHLAGTKVNYELPGYFKGTFQLIARSKRVDTGMQRIQQAAAALTMTNKTLSDGTIIKRIWPMHLPVSYPLSDGDNMEFSVNFEAIYVMIGSVSVD